jgi:DNA-directed RNA polymerase subunit M/transcription elongation factor TFIIS
MVQKLKKIRKVCECKNCGNEAEMQITCTLTDLETDTGSAGSATKNPGQAHRVKGSATCSHCGNEADMWVELP